MKFLYFVLIIGLFSSCAAKRSVISSSDVKPLSEDRLFSMISGHTFTFNSLYVKKFDADVNIPGTSVSLKGSMYLQRDSQIVISIAPILGIELFRAQLTPESVVLIDRTKKQILYTDYRYISNKLKYEVNYSIIQSLLINQISCNQSIDVCLKDYHHGISDGLYFIQNLSERQVNKFSKQRVSNPIFNQYFFNSQNFTLSKYKISNLLVNEQMEINYSDFKSYSDKFFPSSIKILGSKGNESAKIDLNYLQLEFNSNNVIGFKIPDKYEVVNVK